MRLYHKQKESYVVAKGSFAGVFTNLAEIRRVHEMHSDFRISVTQTYIDGDLEASNFGSTSSRGDPRTHPQNTTHYNGTPQSVTQVSVDVEPDRSLRAVAESRASVSTPLRLTDGEKVVGEAQTDSVGHRESPQGGSGYVKDAESRGVVDEDGMCMHGL